ncbi:MAG: RNA polymerase sigma factor [Leptospiraceae bacterium]|nr:RNA polymerase sigma factor [Leptospiraceae bacterium]MCB1319161.1 RNA polymerase sigma factor [Leptospiraceae bacterium]
MTAVFPLMDQDKLKELYDRYADAIYRYLLRLSGSEDLAFDLMQESFLRADRYHSENIQNERAWLYRIAYHVFLADRRKSPPVGSVPDMSSIPEAHSFTGDLHWQMTRAAIERRLHAQDPALARMFILRLDHDFKHDEIARIMELSERTVGRCFEKIRRILLKEFKNDLNLEHRES